MVAILCDRNRGSFGLRAPLHWELRMAHGVDHSPLTMVRAAELYRRQSRYASDRGGPLRELDRPAQGSSSAERTSLSRVASDRSLLRVCRNRPRRPDAVHSSSLRNIGKAGWACRNPLVRVASLMTDTPATGAPGAASSSSSAWTACSQLVPLGPAYVSRVPIVLGG